MISVDLIIKIRINRLITTFGIRTENYPNVEVEVIIFEGLVLLLVPLESIRAMAFRLRVLLVSHKLLSLKIKTMNQSIHVGKNHSSNKISVVDMVATAENGINSAGVILTTLFRCLVMSVSSWSYLETQILVSILASTKTFPWRRRAIKYRNTLRHLMILS